ncbi:Transcription factor IIIB 50 kDa subunit [Holothuria leucospilota]|uniref:Transcription factor IIIB 50 kDa subunit n=1 Tax=Holothuria leucospilota TaxID=206669 RepID=A0A9Q0YP63_HOLLE|nr:Transcription factor IIIB 50 kDa subunit [Holothuria leucospilota]
MAPTTCCGKETIVDDGMRVCEVCGTATEDVNYDHGRTDTGTRCSAEGSYESNLKGIKRSSIFRNKGNYSMSRWKKVTSNAADMLRLNHEKLKEVNTLFEEAYHHPSRSLLFKQEGSKRGLCGACLYVACQRDAIPIPFPDICQAVQAEMSDVFQALKALKTHLGIHVHHPNRFSKDCVQVCLKKYGLESLENDLRDGIQQIFKSLEGCLIETGFKADPNILSVALLAWQRKFSLKMTLKGFQEKSEVSFPKSLKRRLGALRKMLYKMAVEVPWIQTEMVTNANAVTYLDDILKYQQSHRISRISSDSESDDETIEPALKKMKPEEASVRLHNFQETYSKIASHDLDCEELNEDDIPESELNNYIYLDEKKPDVKTLIDKLSSS